MDKNNSEEKQQNNRDRIQENKSNENNQKNKNTQNKTQQNFKRQTPLDKIIKTIRTTLLLGGVLTTIVLADQYNLTEKIESTYNNTKQKISSYFIKDIDNTSYSLINSITERKINNTLSKKDSLVISDLIDSLWQYVPVQQKKLKVKKELMDDPFAYKKIIYSKLDTLVNSSSEAGYLSEKLIPKMDNTDRSILMYKLFLNINGESYNPHILNHFIQKSREKMKDKINN